MPDDFTPAYSPAMDSQAAYAAMPNQGLPTSSGMTPQQRQQLAARLLMNGMQQQAAPPGMPAVPARTVVPTQTLQAGQLIGQTR